jgi:hypothetical protein
MIKLTSIYALVFLFFIQLSVHAQPAGIAPSYLIIRVKPYSVAFSGLRGYVIRPEKGARETDVIYDLEEYLPQKGFKPFDSLFYQNHRGGSVSHQGWYNYFVSVTAALNFMADAGWELVAAIPEVYSSTQNASTTDGKIIPVAEVNSSTAWLFRKINK